MRPFSPLTTAFLAAALALSAGCSRLTVKWTASPREIVVVASGQKDAILVLLAGPPDGPHVIHRFPEVWTTVGPETGRPGGMQVAQVSFDDAGVARATIPAAPLPPGGILLQAVAFKSADPSRPVAVSDCMSVTWQEGSLEIRSHAMEVLRSPIWWRAGAVALVVILCACLRRVPIVWAYRRSWWLAAVFGCAALLILPRVRARDFQRTARPDQPPPILSFARLVPEKPPDPLDRVTKAGFHELIINAGMKIAAGEAINIVLMSDSTQAERDACQAAWLLWPRAVEVRKFGDNPFARRGAYLSFDEGPRKDGTRVLFRNQAGCVWVVEAREPK